jgi:hypothetical protein
MTHHLSLEEFLEEFPEYQEAPPAKVQRKLDDAARRTPLNVWGDMTAEGHKHLTCHLLDIDAYARDARVENDDGQTNHGRVRAQLELSVGLGATPRTT